MLHKVQKEAVLQAGEVVGLFAGRGRGSGAGAGSRM